MRTVAKGTLEIILAFVSIGTSPALGSSQSQPPRPLEELVGEFAADPNRMDILRMAAICPEEGAWNRELLRRILLLPDDRAIATRIAVSLGWTVMNCDVEVLDASFRARLESTAHEEIKPLLAKALYLSRERREVNQVAARRALFDLRFSDETRTSIASQLVKGESASEAIEMIAKGYTENGTAPPMAFLASVMRERGEGSLRAKRIFLEATLSRATDPGAVAMMNGLMSDALNHDRDDVWFLEVGEAVRRITRGAIPVSVELKEFVTPRAVRFRDGG